MAPGKKSKKKKTLAADTAEPTRPSGVYHFSVRWYVPNEEKQHPPDGDASSEWCQAGISKFRTIIARHCDKWICQLERGEEHGKLHMQCYAHRAKKDRPRHFGRLLGGTGLPGVEVSAASTEGIDALRLYCMKQKTRVSGPWLDRPIYQGHDLIVDLLPWQKAVADLVKGNPHPRRIYWFYDSKGGAGKSSFAKWLYYHHKIPTLTFGDAKDLLYVVQKFENRRAYLFDLSRTKGGKSSMSDIYQALESVKNGYFISTKYESDIVCMQTPHVVVFSNHHPDMKCLSTDRFMIVDMNALELGSNGAKKNNTSGVKRSAESSALGTLFSSVSALTHCPRIAPTATPRTYTRFSFHRLPGEENVSGRFEKKSCPGTWVDLRQRTRD